MSSSSPRFSIDTSSTPTSPTSTRSGYPFPGSSNSTRYQPRRSSNASTTSANSIGGSLDTQHGGRRTSTVRETRQNAISTLLQPPIVRTGLGITPHAPPAAAGFKAPTTKDIPPVTLTNIPHVPPDAFRAYVAKIGPLFESFQRGRAEAESAQATWLKKDKELEKTDRFAEALERRFSRDGSVSPTFTRNSSPLDTPRPEAGRRRSSAQGRRSRNEPTPLTTIPNVYFEQDFRLENPRTFDVVSERAEIVRPPPGTPQPEHGGQNGAPRKALATNAILQEKLSWYMDTVEVHLINSISTASSGFFQALGSLKGLQTEAEASVAKIQGLREELRRLDQEVAMRGLEVAAKRRKRANVGRLARATRQVERVVEDVKRADELVDGGEYDEAADQLDRVGRLVCGFGEPGAAGRDEGLIDLRPLKALQGLDSGLQELQYRIGAGFAARFTNILVEDLRRHVEKVPAEQTLKRWSRQRGIPPTYMESPDAFRQDLLAALKGLGRAGYTAQATAAYREAVTRFMKELIRKHLPSSSDDDADSMVSSSTRGGIKLTQQEKSTILARNLRALDGEDAEKLLVQVYTSVGEALRRVSTQTKVLLDVTSSMQPATPTSPIASPPRSPGLGPMSPGLGMGSLDAQLANNAKANGNSQMHNAQDGVSSALDLSSELLGHAVDTAQNQISRVLKVRHEQSVRLEPERFLRYFTLNRLFADECEAVSGRGGQGLRGIITAQINGFVQALGAAENERVARVLDGDDWNAKDFTGKDEVVLERVLGSMSQDPVEWNARPPIWEELAPEPADPGAGAADGEQAATTNGTPAPAATTAAIGAGTKVTTRPATIDSNRYILVRSATALLPSLTTFLSLLTPLGSSLTPQIATQLLEVLKTFNSRSTQLILGAGATRGSAGLKNITTKHLALASQALSFVIAVLPYVRECVRRHLPPVGGGNTQVLAEFDKMKRVYQDHQAALHDKLVEILVVRSAAHVKSMKARGEERYYCIPSDSPPSDDKDDRVSTFIETLTKETAILHRVLSRHLADFDVENIMRRIAEGFAEQWPGAFGEVRAEGAAGRARLVRDAEAFASKLGKIEGFGEVGRRVLEVAKGRGEEGGGGGA